MLNGEPKADKGVEDDRVEKISDGDWVSSNTPDLAELGVGCDRNGEM